MQQLGGSGQQDLVGGDDPPRYGHGECVEHGIGGVVTTHRIQNDLRHSSPYYAQGKYTVPTDQSRSVRFQGVSR